MKVTAKFTGADGREITAVFDAEAGTVTASDGRKGTYSRASNVITIEGEQKMTLTMGGSPDQLAPGYSTTFTSSTGASGTVTIMSVG